MMPVHPFIKNACDTIEPKLTPASLLAEIASLGLQTPSEAAGIVRADRDGR